MSDPIMLAVGQAPHRAPDDVSPPPSPTSSRRSSIGTDPRTTVAAVAQPTFQQEFQAFSGMGRVKALFSRILQFIGKLSEADQKKLAYYDQMQRVKAAFNGVNKSQRLVDAALLKGGAGSIQKAHAAELELKERQGAAFKSAEDLIQAAMAQFTTEERTDVGDLVLHHLATELATDQVKLTGQLAFFFGASTAGADALVDAFIGMDGMTAHVMNVLGILDDREGENFDKIRQFIAQGISKAPGVEDHLQQALVATNAQLDDLSSSGKGSAHYLEMIADFRAQITTLIEGDAVIDETALAQIQHKGISLLQVIRQAGGSVQDMVRTLEGIRRLDRDLAQFKADQTAFPAEIAALDSKLAGLAANLAGQTCSAAEIFAFVEAYGSTAEAIAMVNKLLEGTGQTYESLKAEEARLQVAIADASAAKDRETAGAKDELERRQAAFAQKMADVKAAQLAAVDLRPVPKKVDIGAFRTEERAVVESVFTALPDVISSPEMDALTRARAAYADALRPFDRAIADLKGQTQGLLATAIPLDLAKLRAGFVDRFPAGFPEGTPNRVAGAYKVAAEHKAAENARAAVVAEQDGFPARVVALKQSAETLGCRIDETSGSLSIGLFTKRETTAIFELRTTLAERALENGVTTVVQRIGANEQRREKRLESASVAERRDARTHQKDDLVTFLETMQRSGSESRVLGQYLASVSTGRTVDDDVALSPRVSAAHSARLDDDEASRSPVSSALRPRRAPTGLQPDSDDEDDVVDLTGRVGGSSPGTHEHHE